MTVMNMTQTIRSFQAIARPDGRVVHNLAVMLSLLLVMLAAIAALVLVQGINRQIGDVVHTYDVRNEARALTIALSEAESAQRGFLLTRDDGFLASYRQSASAIGGRLLALSGLTRDDTQQGERVRSIAAEIIDKSAQLERAVELVQAQRAEDARRLIENEIGEGLMGNLHASLEQFIDEENSKLLDRNREIENYRRWLVGAIITALGGAVILAYVLFTRAQRQVSTLAHGSQQLHSEKAVLEAHVLDRTRALEEARAHAEQERQRVEALLQDANHRIGNSLATVSSLLGLQLLRSTSAEVRDALESARARVHAIASSHRRLRLGNDLETISADEFLGAVLEDITLTASDAKAIEMFGQFDPIVVGARDATTIGILVGELVTNALKHAFPAGRSGTIKVSLQSDASGVPVLKVVDDGIGLPESQALGEGGLGSVIVTQLANQFGGVPQYERRATGGLSVSVPMPGLSKSTAI